MSGKWTLRESLMLAGAVILSLSIAYYVGKKQGHLDERLSINSEQLKKSDSSVKSDSAKVVVARKKDAVLDSAHDIARRKIKIVHDSVLVHDSVVVVSPELAQLIQADDSLIAAQKNSLAFQDLYTETLRVGISLRNDRIKLLESQHNSRISHGIQVGVGECWGPNGKTACGYVGYGLQIRVP